MSEKDNGFEYFVVGFIAGCVASAVVSILYAPKSGEETRSLIRGKSEEWINSANRSIDNVYKQAEVATNSAVDKINEFAEIAREQSDTLAERGKDFLSRTQRKIQSAGSAAAEAADEILTTGS